MKKLTRILFCLMLLTLSLAAAAAASAEDYPVWINGEQFTSDKMEIACGSGKATLTLPEGTSEYYTLTLTDAAITSSGYSDGIQAGCMLNMVVEGTNTITVKDDNAAGISAEKALILKGDGSLTLEIGSDSNGITTRDFVFQNKMGGDLTIRGGKCGISSKGFIEFFGAGNIEITDCDVAVYYGMENCNFTLKGSGNVTLAGTNWGIRFT